jgi:hypothetical protein
MARLRETTREPCRNYHPKPEPGAAAGPGEDFRCVQLSRGPFAIVDTAALACDRKARELFACNARLNFPDFM